MRAFLTHIGAAILAALPSGFSFGMERPTGTGQPKQLPGRQKTRPCQRFPKKGIAKQPSGLSPFLFRPFWQSATFAALSFRVKTCNPLWYGPSLVKAKTPLKPVLRKNCYALTAVAPNNPNKV